MNTDLLISLKNGNRMAMEAIYHHHWEDVFDAAFKKIGDEDIAQDICQEIFISLWENRNEIAVESSLGAYLYGAVRFKVINHYRALAVAGGHQAEFALLLDTQGTPAADSRIILQDLSLQVDAAIAQLPERMQCIVSMSRKQDKSIKEIAAELGVSVQTVKNQITAAMKILRKNLSYLPLLALFLS